MHLLNRIPQVQITLSWDRELSGHAAVRARQLRGALARAFAEDDLFHQHDIQGKPLYRYPHIQYRWSRGQGVVTGWGAAVERLLNLPWLDTPLRLGNDPVIITNATLETGHGEFGISQRLLRYRFRSPVLLFNQENYHRFSTMTRDEQTAERDRLLVAQALTALGGLGIHFEVVLYAAFSHAKPQKCRYKSQDLLGLNGGFVSNALLPPGFAIGHAVSHGFGWIVPVTIQT